MNNDEAKFLLSAYRPNGRDAADPAMAEALAQAKRDPALAAWFERQQAHDAAVAAKLRGIAPPPGLRDAILAGARATENARVVRPVWRHPAWLAAAAAVVILLGAFMGWRFAPIHGATLEEFAVNFVDRGFTLQKRSADVAVLKAWLAERQQPLPQTLPTEFARLRALGCRMLEFQGREVSLVCFERGGKEFHVFVVRREAGAIDAPETSPRWIERGRLVAAAWSDASNHYVLVSDAPTETVKRLL